jgi:hypothetical protein
MLDNKNNPDVITAMGGGGGDLVNLPKIIQG